MILDKLNWKCSISQVTQLAACCFRAFQDYSLLFGCQAYSYNQWHWKVLNSTNMATFNSEENLKTCNTCYICLIQSLFFNNALWILACGMVHLHYTCYKHRGYWIVLERWQSLCVWRAVGTYTVVSKAVHFAMDDIQSVLAVSVEASLCNKHEACFSKT